MPDPITTPPPRTSALRRAILPVTLAVISLATMGWLGWGAFETQREDAATARAFLTHIASNNHAEAAQLLTPALAAQVTAPELARRFGQIELWDHIGFSSRSTQTNGSGRSTQLYGTAEAMSGCESTVQIDLHNGRIQAFDVTPICPLAGTDV